MKNPFGPKSAPCGGKYLFRVRFGYGDNHFVYANTWHEAIYAISARWPDRKPSKILVVDRNDKQTTENVKE